MKKTWSCLLLSLGVIAPVATVTVSSCCNDLVGAVQNPISYQNSMIDHSIRKLTFNKKEAKVIHCKGLGDNHFADVGFCYIKGKRVLKIVTFPNSPHSYFDETRPYVKINVFSSNKNRENEKIKFSLTMIGTKELERKIQIVELEDNDRVEFFHWEGDSRAELWDARHVYNKFEDETFLGKSEKFSFLASNDVELWQNYKFDIKNQYNTIFSEFGFILPQKKFDITLVDKHTKEKIAVMLISPLKDRIYLFSCVNQTKKERKLFYQDTNKNKYCFSLKQNNYYVIENLTKQTIDFNFSNIDDFELQSDQMDRVKYLIEMSNKNWYYLTTDDILNAKNRHEYVLTNQDHVLMQYAFKKIVNDNPYLKKNLLSSKYKCFYQWILSSKEALFYYLTAGHAQPKNNLDKYTFWIDIDNSSDSEWQAFEIWYDIWRNYSESSSGKYLKISIAIALEFANGIAQRCASDEDIAPLKRYELFVWLDSQGVYKTRPLENNSIQELRNIVGPKTGNEDLKWLYEYIRLVLEKDPDYDFITSGHSLLQYLKYSIYSSVHGDDFYGPKNLGIYRLIKYSGVCEAMGTIGAIVANLFGIQAMTVGHPGHCAFLYHNDRTVGYRIGYNTVGWEGIAGYHTWIQWMFADDQMHCYSQYLYDEFYAINNYIDGSLLKDQQETNKQKVIKNFHTLLEKNNKQICISQTSQWGWIKRGQIFKHFAKYDYLQKEINSLKEKTVDQINNIFQGFEENRDAVLRYYI